MSVKFFGQFLIERGEVDAGQLREAIELMKSENRDVGEIAIEKGYLTEADCVRINDGQRTRNLPFGAFAIELGLLTGAQLDEVLRTQNESRLQLGDALVRLGHLAEDRLAALLDRFKPVQAVHQSGRVELLASLGSHRLAVWLVDLIPRFCLRVARIHVKLSPARQREQIPELDFEVELKIRGNPGIGISLMADRDFARQLAAGVSGLDPDGLDRAMVEDGMGEFLNLLAGNAVSMLEREGSSAELEPPSFEAAPAAAADWMLEVVASTGRGVLLLAAE